MASIVFSAPSPRPRTCTCSLIFGIVCAGGHHAFYQALDGRPADHQLLMLRYGTLLAWTSKAGLSAAVVMAFRQRVWTTVRTAVALAVFVPLSPLIVILTANHGLAWEEAEEKERSGVKKVRIGYGPVTRPAWGWGHAPRPGFGPEGEGDADQARGRHLEGKAACRLVDPPWSGSNPSPFFFFLFFSFFSFSFAALMHAPWRDTLPTHGTQHRFPGPAQPSPARRVP